MNKNKKRKTLNQGQMLLELVFSLSIVTLVLVALISSAILSLKNSRLALNKVLANHYSQLTFEYIRAYRNLQGFTQLTAGCYENITNTGKFPVPSEVCENWQSFSFIKDKEDKDTIFKRKIIITDENLDKKKVTVIVAWQDSDCNTSFCHQTKLTSFLTRWSK